MVHPGQDGVVAAQFVVVYLVELDVASVDIAEEEVVEGGEGGHEGGGGERFPGV